MPYSRLQFAQLFRTRTLTRSPRRRRGAAEPGAVGKLRLQHMLPSPDAENPKHAGEAEATQTHDLPKTPHPEPARQ